MARKKKTAAANSAIRDRIKDFRRVRAGDIRPNPRNWRTHSTAQAEALKGILAEVGIADALLVRELEDGSLELIDGELRTDLDPDTTWPCLVLDVTEEEANKLLATLDPIAAMAGEDDEKLADLLQQVQTDSAGVRQLLADLAGGDALLGEFEAEEDDLSGRPKQLHKMDLQPHEHYDYLVVLATTTQDWNVLCEKLGLRPKKRRGRMGTCRAIRAEKLLELLEKVE